MKFFDALPPMSWAAALQEKGERQREANIIIWTELARLYGASVPRSVAEQTMDEFADVQATEDSAALVLFQLRDLSEGR